MILCSNLATRQAYITIITQFSFTLAKRSRPPRQNVHFFSFTSVPASLHCILCDFQPKRKRKSNGWKISRAGEGIAICNKQKGVFFLYPLTHTSPFSSSPSHLTPDPFLIHSSLPVGIPHVNCQLPKSESLVFGSSPARPHITTTQQDSVLQSTRQNKILLLSVQRYRRPPHAKKSKTAKATLVC